MADRIIDKKCRQKKIDERTTTINGYLSGKLFKLSIYVVNGLAWTTIAAFEDNLAIAFLVSIIFTLAVLIAIIDFRIHIIPNELVLALMVLGAIFQLLNFGALDLMIAIGCMIGIVVIFLILGAIMGLDKVGAGDVKLAGAMALTLGYPSVLIGALAMAIVILVYCFVGFCAYRLTLKSMFAYAPFIMSGLVAGLAYIISGFDII